MNKNEPTQEQLAMLAKISQHAKDINCACGNQIFLQGVRLKSVSKLVTGQDKDIILPIPTVFCQKCGAELSDNGTPEAASIIK